MTGALCSMCGACCLVRCGVVSIVHDVWCDVYGVVWCAVLWCGVVFCV